MKAPKIEKNIPLPAARSGTLMWPFSKLEIGDSFTAPLNKKDYLRNECRRQGKRLSRTFTTRTVDSATVRVWRTK